MTQQPLAPAWPPPPAGYGWPPPPAWGPPPSHLPTNLWAPPGPAQPPPAEPALDEAVRARRHVPGRWFLAGLAQVLNPLAVLVVLVLAVALLGLPRTSDAGAFYTVVAGLVSGAVVIATGRTLAARQGGWRTAFGLDTPRPRDALTALGWFGIQFVARVALVMVLAGLSPGLADPHGGNVEGARAVHGLATAYLLLGAVVIAPFFEEVSFRGILLRGLMRRMGFWPAALLSSALFASLHIPGAAHLAAIPMLVLSIFLFGLLQCVLVRRTGRLAPAMGVHALLNLTVTLLALSSS